MKRGSKNYNNRNHNTWTPNEIKILLEKYPLLGPDIPELSHRTKRSIRNKANLLGLITRQKWTEEEISILKEKYPYMGVFIPELSHRSQYSIRIKAKQLHVKYKFGDRNHKPDQSYPGTNTHNPWTLKELSILEEKYPYRGPNVVEEIPGHTRIAVQKKAQVMGLKWIYDNPYLNKKDERIGFEKMMSCGLNAKIINYKNSQNISIEFEDGIILNDQVMFSFRTGQIAHPFLSRFPVSPKVFHGIRNIILLDSSNSSDMPEHPVQYECHCLKCEKSQVLEVHQMIDHIIACYGSIEDADKFAEIQQNNPQ